MKNDDNYKSEFEEHRQKIKLEDGDKISTTSSRAELHRKNRRIKKKPRHVMINSILVLFALIPVLILVLVFTKWNSPDDKITKAEQDSQVKYETSGNNNNNNSIAEKAAEEEKKAEEAAAEKRKEEQAKAEAKAKEEAEAESKAKALEEEKALEEQKAKIEAEAEAKAEKERLEKEKAEKENEKKAAARTHEVLPGETLYSISVIYYKSGKGVENIKQANGITSNEIYVGQSLIIP